MPDETKTVILTQKESERLALDHAGGLAVYGSKGQAALQHNVGGEVTHGTTPGKPLVHMVCWDADDPCRVEHSGRVTIAGDERAPLPVTMTHNFVGDHHQTHLVAPLDHTLQVSTALASPIHHALQMRTPLQVRFCNPWRVASDYTVEVRMGERSFMSIRLTGATIATPEPCVEEPCPPVAADPHRP